MDEETVVDSPEARALEIEFPCDACGTPWGPCPVHRSAARVIRNAMNDAREAVLFEMERLMEHGGSWRAAIDLLRDKAW